MDCLVKVFYKLDASCFDMHEVQSVLIQTHSKISKSMVVLKVVLNIPLDSGLQHDKLVVPWMD